MADQLAIAPSSLLLGLGSAHMLAWREVTRFFRQRHRVIGAIGQPILFWLLFGAGLSRSFRLSPAAEAFGPSFLEYYFPGSLVLILLFTAIFATISIIEDRREGFLQAVLVSPAPRWSMVLGKIVGGTAIALVQALAFLLLALTLNVRFTLPATLALVALLTLLALALTSLGFALAWRMDSTQGFHAVMNLFLMPLWLLSGAFFPAPAPAAGEWGQTALHWVMRLNPVTYGVAGVRRLLWPADVAEAGSRLFWLPSLGMCWVVTFVFAVVMFGLACRAARRTTTGDLQ